MTQTTKHFALGGGLDLVTPPIAMPPGHLIACSNYEPVMNGYRRIDGYERFDGHTKPSEASYWVLGFDAGTATIAAGATVTGATSAATGAALVDAVVTSGSYGASDAAGYLVLTAVTGTFADDENLQVSGVTRCVADGTANEDGATNDSDDAAWQQDAIETARAAIQAVPGSGAIRGVWIYKGVKYAVRDNAGATAGILHKATVAGWVACDLGRTVDFTSGGTVEIAEGDTITGATSAATALVKRVIVTSGTWAGGDAAGRLILSGQTGTFAAENLNVGASLNVATIAGDSTAHALPAGGRYEFVNHNFYGASDLLRMYGCNGVGRAFEWDGTVFVPVITGMAADTPDHIAVHFNHLFLSFAGGSVQHSGTGDPLGWDVILGAGEIGLGEEVVAMLADVAGVMAILGRNKVAVLYGADAASWELKTLTNEAGAIEWTAQVLGSPVFLDDRGLRALSATQAYGDFAMGTMTRMVEPLFQAARKAGVTPVASVRLRGKDQYRLFWSSGAALVMYVGAKSPQFTVLDYGLVVRCICAVDDIAAGRDVVLFGSDDGYVYEMDAGTSFDGAAMEYYLRPAFNHVGAPTQNKRWHKATLEIDAAPNTNIMVSAEFSYGDSNLPAAQDIAFAVRGGGGFWNEAFWNEFYWSSSVEGLAEAHLDGLGTNISVAVSGASTYEQPHTIHGLTLHFSPRALQR
jgi:hypothetical protein